MSEIEEDGKMMEAAPGDEDIFEDLKGWYRKDADHWSEWREEAQECYRFMAGDQWDQKDKSALEAKGRVPIVFNRCAVIIESVAGSEINNRQEVRYLPRELGDSKANEVLTGAGEWFRDEAHSEDEESDAFRDALICGMGWTETRLDYTDDEAGAPYDERISPLEMVVDSASSRANAIDARRMFRVKRMSRGEAKALAPEADAAMLDATWADDVEADGEAKRIKHGDRYASDGTPEISDDDEVTIVHAQWMTTKTIYRVPDTAGAGMVEVTQEVYDALKAKVPGLMGEVSTKRVVMQAFLGGEMLGEPSETLCGKFSWNCVTGKRDQAKGVWYGMMRSMLDPQRWANKWLSQTLHILNSNAKGGYFAETDAFLDAKQAEKSIAKADELTWMQPGGMGKIQPKQGTTFPAGFNDLMQYAIGSIRDVSGVNLELLGQRDDAMSSGVLEYQRRQSAMTTLATLFASLRRYRKIKGRLVLSLIKDYLNDGRLVRIVGDGNAQYVNLAINAAAEYDVIVDESASSPNEKERSWSVISSMLPAIKDQMTPELWMSVLEYSPLPSGMVEKIRGQIEQASQSGQEDPATAKAKAEMQAKQMQMQADQQMRAAELQAQIERDRQKQAAEIEMMQMRAAADLQIRREEAAQKLQLRREEMMLEAQLKRDQMMLIGPTAGPGDEANISRM